MRILCVLLPHFPWRCEAMRRPDIAGKPAIVVQSKDCRRLAKIVIDHSPGLDNLAYGMPVQQALARHDDVDMSNPIFPITAPFLPASLTRWSRSARWWKAPIWLCLHRR